MLEGAIVWGIIGGVVGLISYVTSKRKEGKV